MSAGERREGLQRSSSAWATLPRSGAAGAGADAQQRGARGPGGRDAAQRAAGVPGRRRGRARHRRLPPPPGSGRSGGAQEQAQGASCFSRDLGGTRRGARAPGPPAAGQGRREDGGPHEAGLAADAYEAVVAALYLDGGLEAAARVITAALDGELAGERRLSVRDPKSTLQERLQARSLPLPDYVIVAEEGPAHQRLFRVQCLVCGEALGEGEGTSKQAAEQLAASAALDVLRARDRRAGSSPRPRCNASGGYQPVVVLPARTPKKHGGVPPPCDRPRPTGGTGFTLVETEANGDAQHDRHGNAVEQGRRVQPRRAASIAAGDSSSEP